MSLIDQNNQAATPTSNVAAILTAMAFTFSFRPAPVEKILASIADLDGVKPSIEDEAVFEILERDADSNPTKARRKAITVELQVPEWINNIPEELGQKAILQQVAEFCKSQYIDNYLEIGEHDYSSIIKLAATNVRSGRISVSDEVLDAAVESLVAHLVQTTNNTKIGEIVGKAARGKFTQTAMTRHLNQCDEPLILKLQARLEAWALFLAESGAPEADDLAPAYELWVANLNKVSERLRSANEEFVISEIL